jgi:hypothetical protein
MTGSPLAQQVLAAWKTKKENQRDWLQKSLSQNAANPTQAWKRQMMVTRGQRKAEAQKNWAEAYHQHFQKMYDIFSSQPQKTAETTPKVSVSSKGSMD